MSVVQQPGAPAQMMAAPQAPPDCPPGLEYLTQVDQILVHQEVELLEGEKLTLYRHVDQ